MAHQITDDPRLGYLLNQSSDSNIVAKVGLIGYPCDEGVARNNGRIGSRKGPASFRKYFHRLGTVYNPEYELDLTKIQLRDLGDVDVTGNLEQTHANLLYKVEQALREDFIPVIIGGGNDQSYPNARALMNLFSGKIGVINIDAHLDVRPLKGDPPNLAHSGSPFRQLLQDPDFRSDHGVFMEYACQGHQCSKMHAEFVEKNGGNIRWLSDIRRSDQNISEEFFDILTKSVGQQDDRPVFVSFDIDSIKSADCPGVSCPGTIGLTAEEALEICRVAGKCTQVRLIDFSEYNPEVEEDRTGRLLVNMVYHFLMGVVERYTGGKGGRDH